MRELADFIKGMLSKDAPESLGRSGCIFIVYMLVVWATYIVFSTMIIPDVPKGWAALAVFLFLGGKSLDVGMAAVTTKGASNGSPTDQATPQ